MGDDTREVESVEILTSKLEILPPGSQITISWTSSTTETIRVDGKLVDYDPQSATRRIETTDRTLLLIPDISQGEVTVTELTQSTETVTLGELQTLIIKHQAQETLEITSHGITVPSYLIGYSGFLIAETNKQAQELRIPEPGLEQYDERLLSLLEDVKGNEENKFVKIRTTTGPHRRYKVLDKKKETQTNASSTDKLTNKYDSIEPLIHTVAALSKKVDNDDILAEDIKREVWYKLQSLQTSLLTVRETVCQPDPDPRWKPAAQQADMETNEYPAVLEEIQVELERLQELSLEESIKDVYSLAAAELDRSQRTIDDLYSRLCPPVSDTDSHNWDTYIPPREFADGRGNGAGRWLECQLRNSLHRWGYSAGIRENVYCVEVDVIATRFEPQNDPTDWIVAECKDWENRPITPDVIFRLCMVAYTCRAVPLLCHTTHLTERAWEIARAWEVRVLSLEDLFRGALPAPNMLSIDSDVSELLTGYTAREVRGRLPIAFLQRPNTHFTYVPGYEPVGRLHEYQPIEADSENGTPSDYSNIP